jgi:acetyl esterase
MADHVLEPSAQSIAGNTSKPPFLYEIGPGAAREVLDDIQAAPIDKPDVDDKWITVLAEVGVSEGRHPARIHGAQPGAQ